MVTVLMFMYSSIASSPLKNSLINVFLKFIYLHLYLQDYNKKNSVSYFNNNSRISMLDQVMVCWFHCYIRTKLLHVTLLSVKWINYLSKKRVTQTSRDTSYCFIDFLKYICQSISVCYCFCLFSDILSLNLN